VLDETVKTNVFHFVVDVVWLGNQHDIQHTGLKDNVVVFKGKDKASDADIFEAEDQLVNNLNLHKTFPAGRKEIIGLAMRRTICRLSSLFYDDTSKSFKILLLKHYTFGAITNLADFLVDMFKLMRWIASARDTV
jgi:hypothetical protein